MVYSLPPTPTPTSTPSRTPTPLPAGIHGIVTYNGAPAPPIPLTLWFYNGKDWGSTPATTQRRMVRTCLAPSPSLSNGQAYLVLYLNNIGDSDFLNAWYGPIIQGYTSGSDAVAETSISPTLRLSLRCMKALARSLPHSPGKREDAPETL